MAVPPLPKPETSGKFFETYTDGLTTADLERLFTRDAPDAYRFFSRAIDAGRLKALPWHRRAIEHARLLFLAFTLKLSPARRAIFGAALVSALVGLMRLFTGIHILLVPHPVFVPGTLWLLAGFLLLNLLVLLEVADRLSLKNDLEIARGIQQAMLPRGAYLAPGVEAFGMTRPANTVGGDFYDIQSLPDGRVLLALGDVAGKGSPAALLMALLLAMMRTLVDEGMEGAALMARLNVQINKHAPKSRFVTLFTATLDPATGEYERLTEGGIALGMFDRAEYVTGRTVIRTGDVLVLYSDGVTEAEDGAEQPFEEVGVQSVMDLHGERSARELAWSLFAAVEQHAQERRLLDDLTVLAVRRLPPLPSIDRAVAATTGA